MSARQFGRDSGDMYGRHALVNPGGDNQQIDVLHVVGTVIHPTRLSDDYVGRHRPLPETRYAVRSATYGDGIARIPVRSNR